MELTIGLAIGFLVGSFGLHKRIQKEFLVYKKTSALKKILARKKEQGHEWFDFSLDHKHEAQVHFMNFLDKKRMSYSMVPSENLKRVIFSVDLENKKVEKTEGNVFFANFGKPSSKKQEKMGTLLVGNFPKKAG